VCDGGGRVESGKLHRGLRDQITLVVFVVIK
jgi:hypothetical protein